MSGILQLCIRDNGAGNYFPMDAYKFIHYKTDLPTLKDALAALDTPTFNIAYMSRPNPGVHHEALHRDVPKSFNLRGKWEA